MTDARVDGVTGYWYGKSPGLDRASDALGTRTSSGRTRAAARLRSSGTIPPPSRRRCRAPPRSCSPTSGCPSCTRLIPRTCSIWGPMPWRCRAVRPVGRAKIVTNVADGSGNVQVDCDRVVRGARGDSRANQGAPPDGPDAPAALSEMERSREGVRMDMARAYALANRLNKQRDLRPYRQLGIVAAGKTYLDMRQALRTLGLDEAGLRARGVRLLRLAMIHPLMPRRSKSSRTAWTRSSSSRRSGPSSSLPSRRSFTG